MQKHTPGPWTILKDGLTIEKQYDDHRPEFIVAKAAHPANGRLIAAAPDLLAALRAFVDGANVCAGHGLPLMQTHGEAECGEWRRILKARAALAKATGAK